MNIRKEEYMNKRIIIAATMAALVLGGCAKEIPAGIFDDESRYLNAWLKQDHTDDWEININRNPETGLPDTLGRGVFLLSETEGSGNAAINGSYVKIHFVERLLNGTISASSAEDQAKQLLTYDKTYYYGPQIFCLSTGVNTAGFVDAIKGMKEGGKRTVLIPQWLNSNSDFATEQEYKNVSNADASSCIYEIELLQVIYDFDQYRIDEIEKFINEGIEQKRWKYENSGKFVDKVDSIGRGFYFIPITDTTGHKAFPSDTTIKINYTGYRLDGQAFDTTVKKTAIDNYIQSSSATYEPKEIKWAETYSGLTMDGSSLIKGFTKTIWQMNRGKGIGIFWSSLGYGSSASGNRIPAYAPLMFEVEFVKEEE